MRTYIIRTEDPKTLNTIKSWAAKAGMSLKKFLLLAAEEKAERDKLK